MNLNAMKARIEKLEVVRALPMVAHRVIQGMGESEAEAVHRYEQHAGVHVGSEDLLVIRRIIA